MKLYRSTLILCMLLAGFLPSCEEDDDMEMVGSKGSIFVNVKFNGQPVQGAMITTEPASDTVFTDVTGAAILLEIPVGGYKVTVEHPDIGSGSGSATVKTDEVTDVVVHLIGGLFDKPYVVITNPVNGTLVNLGDLVYFSAVVSDTKDAPGSLALEWSSNIDGVLSNQPADVYGNSSFSYDGLTAGEHIIILKAGDSDGLENTFSVLLIIKQAPQAVVLDPVTVTSSGFELHWSVTPETGFQQYNLYRSDVFNPYEVQIGLITDVNATTFTDKEIKFGIPYSYRVGLIVNGDAEVFSNVQMATFLGENINVATQVEMLLVDPNRPFIYALDRINNSLLFINKTTSSVEKTIFVGSAPVDMDLNLEGNKMYIANSGSTQIAIIDLDSQTKEKDIFVNPNVGSYGGNPYRLAWLAGNYLAYTSYDQWNSIKLVNADNGMFIQDIGTIYQPGLSTNPDRTVLYATESGTTGSRAVRYNLENGQLTEVDASPTQIGFAKDAPVSGNGAYLFYNGNKLLTSNLSSNLGTYNEAIHVSNFDGSIVVGTDHIFDGQNFGIIRPLPLTSSVMALDTDGNTLYVYDINSSKIAIIKIFD